MAQPIVSMPAEAIEMVSAQAVEGGQACETPTNPELIKRKSERTKSSHHYADLHNSGKAPDYEPSGTVNQ